MNASLRLSARSPKPRDASSVKRAFDILFAAVALLAFSPLLVILAIIVRLESPGPVLFRQRRIGMGEAPFQVLKFRTMRSAPGDEESTPALSSLLQVCLFLSRKLLLVQLV